MSHVVQFKGETDPDVSYVIEVDGAPVNLTGRTVKFRMRPATATTLVVDAVATAPAPATGEAVYQWAEADVDETGFYAAWFHVVELDHSTEEFLVEIREHGPEAGDLTSLLAVRDVLQKAAADVKQDPTIMRLLRPASKAVISHTGAELAPPKTNETRRFRVHPRRRGRDGAVLVELGPAPCDLRAATEVTLHPESATGAKVLSEGVDFMLHHEVGRYGVYRALLLNPSLAFQSDLAGRFGFAQLDVRGNWGFATVPAEVDYWTAIQIKLWMRQEIQAFTTTVKAAEGITVVERAAHLSKAVMDGLGELGLSRPRFA